MTTMGRDTRYRKGKAMTNRFSAVAVSALLTVGISALAENGRDYFGVGGESCSTWIDARKTNNTSRQGSWLLGYLSALNLWGVIGRKDALSGMDADGLYAWMDRYCESHPLETIATGAGALGRELAQRAQ
jgi:hypothetical protein